MRLRVYTIITACALGLVVSTSFAAEMMRKDRLVESQTNDLDSNYNVEKNAAKQLCECVKKINNQCVERICKKVTPKAGKSLRDH